MNQGYDVLGIPDLERKQTTTGVIFNQDQMLVNQELERRTFNAIQKAFGKRRRQKSTDVWLMVVTVDTQDMLQYFRKKAEVALAEIQPKIESFGLVVDSIFVNQACLGGSRLISFRLTIRKVSRKRLHGIVGIHLALAGRKKARIKYPLPPRLVKK